MIECDSLTFAYDSRFCLGPVDLSIKTGSVVGLIGPNGSGKTTLLHLLAGVLTADHGEISVNGTRYTALERREKFALLRYDGSWYYDLTFLEHIAFVSRFYRTWDSQVADRLVERFSIPVDVKLGKLSSGSRVKLGLVLALARRTELVLLDEPWNALDPVSRAQLSEEIARASESGRTIIVSSHELEQMEAVADRVVTFKNGTIAKDAPIERTTARRSALVEAYGT